MVSRIVSVIVPAYNARKYIGRCLCSVYQDALPEDKFEVIVINDGSTDDTLDIVEESRCRHENLVVLNKENGGVSSARNRGIAEAHGKYVLFLDADDELIAGSFERVCKILSEKGVVDMLVTRQVRNDGQKEWLPPQPKIEQGTSYSGVEAFKKGYLRMNAGGGICRTAFLRDNQIFFPENVSNAEDTIFFGLVQVFAKSVVFFDLNLYRINQLRESASRVDHTLLGLRHVNSVKSISRLRDYLDCNEDQKGIIEQVTYQLLSNTVAHFVQSDKLKYRQLCELISIDEILPINTQRMNGFKAKARIMNHSFLFFYFLSWILHTIK